MVGQLVLPTGPGSIPGDGGTFGGGGTLVWRGFAGLPGGPCLGRRVSSEEIKDGID